MPSKWEGFAFLIKADILFNHNSETKAKLKSVQFALKDKCSDSKVQIHFSRKANAKTNTFAQIL